MAVETALSVLRILEQERPLPRVVVICGPQAFLREYVLDAVRGRFLKHGRQARAFQIGAGDNFDAVLDELRGSDLFAPKRLVVCRVLKSRRAQESDGDGETDSRSGAVKGEAGLLQAIEDQTAPSELILIYERDSAPAKIRRAVERAGMLVNCLRPFDNQLAQYAELFARRLSLKLTPDATDALVSRCAGDLGAMANALATAVLHLEPGAKVPADAMREAGSGRIPELFEVAEALARGQLALALALIDRAIAVGRDVFEILAVELIPTLRRMMLAAAMIEKKRGAQEIATALGFSPTSGLVNRTIEGARRFGAERLRRAHQRACELDAGFKMGLLKDRETAISAMLIELMAPAGREPGSGAVARR